MEGVSSSLETIEGSGEYYLVIVYRQPFLFNKTLPCSNLMGIGGVCTG
jgi:hypothetical protein